MNARELSNENLINRAKEIHRRERALKSEFLIVFTEIYRRRLYLEYGCSSLFEFLTREMGYSAGSAQRRVEAIRLAVQVPEVTSQVREGNVNLSTLSQLQSFIYAEEKISGQRMLVSNKAALLAQVCGKTREEAVEVLSRALPAASIKLHEQKQNGLRKVGPEITRMTVGLDQNLADKLKRVQEVSGCGSRGDRLAELLHLVFDEYLKRHDPMQKAQRQAERKTETLNLSESISRTAPQQGLPVRTPAATAATATTEGKASPQMTVVPTAISKLETARVSNQTKVCATSLTMQRLAIPAAIRHAVWMRDGGQCQFRSHDTGRICGSRRWIEMDHIQPVALGGDNTPENLRCVCRAHNQHLARKSFGQNLIHRMVVAKRERMAALPI